MKIKKLISVLLCVILTCSCLSVLSAGASIESERAYKPLDLVIVMDASGSMNRSDPEQSALAAVRMLVNMMPAKDSRVGIVSFNENATYITKDASGNATLFSLQEINDVESIKSLVKKVVYNGYTGVGNGLHAATELLNQDVNADRQRAIILFTDGVNEFTGTAANQKSKAAKCDENEANAIMWAKKNNCPVYCVAYDYTLSNGSQSLGAEGMKKLENISKSTNGTFKAINNIKEIEQLLVEFLADVCDLNYTTVTTIPGDGGIHECPIEISPSVVEANIRIAGGDKDAIAKGKVELVDPNGNKVQLRNAGNIRYDVDATAGSIKITMPMSGTWRLRVEGIKGEDIHIGLLEHFKMDLTSQLIFPEGNPEGVAYNGDTIGIKTWLTYEGKQLNNEDLYNAVNSATAICVPRANPKDKIAVDLTREGMAFVGSFVIPQDCYYDITIRIDWDTVYRENTLEVRSSNKPAYFKDADGFPEVVKVNKRKTVSLDNIYQYVIDDENDEITASIASVGSPDVVDVALNGDKIDITGKKMSSSLVTVQFTDSHGNVIEDTFKVKVNDPLFWALIVLFIIACIAAALLIPYMGYLKSLKIKGKIYLTQIELSDGNDEYGLPETLVFTGLDGTNGIEGDPDAMFINGERFYRKKERRNVAGLIEETLDLFRGYEAGTPQFQAKTLLNSNTARELMTGAEKSKVVGTPFGTPFKIKVHKKTFGLTVNKGSMAIVESGKDFELLFKVKADGASRRSRKYLKIQYHFISHVRVKKPAKRR